MNDFSFMKTGINNNNHQTIDITSIVGIFTEDAIKIASLYTTHSNRTIITKTDIQNALKFRACHNTLFLDNIKERIENFEKFLQNYSSEDESEDEQMEESIEEYTQSQCTCILCEKMNNIDTYWNQWNPDNQMDIIVKNAISKTL